MATVTERLLTMVVHVHSDVQPQIPSSYRSSHDATTQRSAMAGRTSVYWRTARSMVRMVEGVRGNGWLPRSLASVSTTPSSWPPSESASDRKAKMTYASYASRHRSIRGAESTHTSDATEARA